VQQVQAAVLQQLGNSIQITVPAQLNRSEEELRGLTEAQRAQYYAARNEYIERERRRVLQEKVGGCRAGSGAALLLWCRGPSWL
jgi:hypothetical protein